MATKSIQVVHEAGRHRFVVREPRELGELTYVPLEHALDLTHTWVEPAARGRGVAAQLVQAAFDHARAQGLRIIPTCPYIRTWLARHPEQRDLVTTR